jgi:hypothetical protein
MYHTIQFAETRSLGLETSSKNPLERRTFQKGVRLKAQVRPRVKETRNGPIEMADLFFEDGTAARAVRYAMFSFID